MSDKFTAVIDNIPREKRVLILGEVPVSKRDISRYIPAVNILYDKNTWLGKLIERSSDERGFPISGYSIDDTQDQIDIVEEYRVLIDSCDAVLALLNKKRTLAQDFAIGYAKSCNKLLFIKTIKGDLNDSSGDNFVMKRRVDDRGRICIPPSLMKIMGAEIGDVIWQEKFDSGIRISLSADNGIKTKIGAHRRFRIMQELLKEQIESPDYVEFSIDDQKRLYLRKAH